MAYSDRTSLDHESSTDIPLANRTRSPFTYEGREAEIPQVHYGAGDAPEVAYGGYGKDAPEVAYNGHGKDAPEVVHDGGLEVNEEDDWKNGMNSAFQTTPELERLPQYLSPDRQLQSQSAVPLIGAGAGMSKEDDWRNESQKPKEKRMCGMPRKWFYILLAVIVVVVIVAAVVGAFRGKKHSTSPSSSSSPSSSPISSSGIISNTSRLAAVAFEDPYGIQQSRLYYQDTNNYIIESAWNATSNTWYVSNNNLTLAKPGTAIAASAWSRKNQTILNLFYFESANNTIGQLRSADAGISWHIPDNLPSASTRTADADSKLTAALHGHAYCTDCSNNTILIWQSNGAFAAANISTGNNSVWDFTANGLSDAAPIAGTDLSMFAYQDGELRLWFQGEEDDLHFFAYPDDSGAANWIDRGNLAQAITPSTPLTAFCAYEPDTATSQVYQIVYFQNQTQPLLNVTGWMNEPNVTDWSADYSPSNMAWALPNETVLAATEMRRVYTLSGGVVMEWEVDQTSEWVWNSWSQLGSVVSAGEKAS